VKEREHLEDTDEDYRIMCNSYNRIPTERCAWIGKDKRRDVLTVRKLREM